MNWHDPLLCGCKINLRLKVTSRRQDGMHELSTLFLPLDFPGDTLELHDAHALTLTVPEFPELAGESNLVYRAAKLFADCSGIAPQWHFVLHKTAPVAAGLGGGSEDAAAALRLLNARYEAFDAPALAKMALSLGADVPFFLTRQPAWATGVGEVLEMVPMPEKLPEVLIVYPGFPVSAKWAYTHLTPDLITPERAGIKDDFAAAFTDPSNADWQSLCRNDLAVALWKKFPLLTLLRDELTASGAVAVQVSGSGSSLFALFGCGSQAAAESLKAKFGHLHGFRIFTGGKEW